jgi:dephospho-CoA kinase
VRQFPPQITCRCFQTRQRCVAFCVRTVHRTIHTRRVQIVAQADLCNSDKTYTGIFEPIQKQLAQLFLHALSNAVRSFMFFRHPQRLELSFSLVKAPHVQIPILTVKTIGLTGGIASGKSTVSTFLRSIGVHVVDADAVYHALISPLPNGQPSFLAQHIAERFPETLMPNGTINRILLGTKVFSDAKAKQELEAITHPEVAKATHKLFNDLEQQGVTHAVYDVPLLFERNLHTSMHATVLVWVPQALHIQRLMLRDNLSQEQALARIQAQMPLDHKKTLATYCIDNSGTREDSFSQAQKIWGIVTQS